MSEIENKLHELVKPIVEDNGYELYHVEYVKEQNEYYLRIYIDSTNGISLNDCETVSRAVSDMLDVTDPIKDQYYLEVSSPGIDRQLFTEEHIAKSIGLQVLVKLSKAVDGHKNIKGKLLETTENEIIVENDNDKVTIPKEKIKTINIIGEI
ncbi:ribosome maturation factor RimP [Clostridium sp. 'White wine YQ']|uniref:ribosome maturation factor RimP n=1 Tax=Clostridium sp. 'White wine YQ' TaxID=3027474 RepID=UPI0023655827|nr:ribosome maturation factor RimP [Clostridium sp. 'White wine YQ']MDD7793792.1 ribosome maturation factor RimP [Clostridium sp. 'White wine YQ']